MAANRCLFVLDTVPCLKEMTEEPSGHTHALHAFRCPSGHRCYQTADGQALDSDNKLEVTFGISRLAVRNGRS